MFNKLLAHSQVPCEIVTKMKEDFEALDRKIKNAAKSFHTYFKMKGEPSCADTISFLNDYLKKRMGCRFLRQDMQVFLLVISYLLAHAMEISSD